MSDAGSPKARRPGRLPPGRHGLSRSFVADNQRERILMATIEATAASGYARMSVDDIVRGAGVSRRTFYELFANKQEAFLAAFDAAAGALLRTVQAASERETTFEGKVIAGFRAFLETLAGSPGPAQVCIVEALAAGPAAIERRTAVMAAFAQEIEDSAPMVPGSHALPALTAETIVGGVYATIFRRISAGRAQELPGLLPDLIESALLPYVGPRAAAAQAQRLRATGSGAGRSFSAARQTSCRAGGGR
jgi:AcrR family transcriptional regulator